MWLILGPPYNESGLFAAMWQAFFYGVLRDLRISWYVANHIEYWYICWYRLYQRGDIPTCH